MCIIRVAFCALKYDRASADRSAKVPSCQSVPLVSQKDIYKIDEVRALSRRTFLLYTKQNKFIVATRLLSVQNHARYSSQVDEETSSRMWRMSRERIRYHDGEEMS